MKRKSLLFLLLMALFAPLAMNGQQALPYSYGFENNNLATDGWTTQNPSGLNASEFGIIGTAAQNGSYGFRFSSYNDRGASTQYLISPELNTPRGVVVQFSYKASSSSTSGETFQVGYSTTDTDITSFTFGTANDATNTTWAQTEEFIFPAGTKYVAVYYSPNYQYRLYVDDFTFSNPPACIPPTNLAVTTDGQTATVTWDGTAANNFIVTVNGTPATGKTSPYTFNVALSTTYEVIVEADCGADGTSDPVSTSFTTPECIGGHVINYTLTDSYDDGWEGSSIAVVDGCGNTIQTLTVADGASPLNGTLTLCGSYYEFVYTQGNYPSEYGWTFTEGGTTLFSATTASGLNTGAVLYTLGTLVPAPTNLTAGTPGTNSVVLNWTAGGSETSWQICINGDEANLITANTNVDYLLSNLDLDTDYTVKVRAINGNNQSCWSNTVSFTTEASNCPKPTNVTASNITINSAHISWDGEADNYNVRYATATVSGTTLDPVFEDGFESGLGNWTTYANGFSNENTNWQTFNASQFESSSNHGGSYSAMSRSWTSTTGDVSVDNWLVTPQITLGNTLKFWVATNEGFEDSYAVYVSTGSGVVPSSGTGDFVVVANLTPATGTWTEKTYDLSAYAGQQGYVAIRHKDNAKDHLLVDDFGVYNTINAYTYGTFTTLPPTSETSCDITGLSPETLYVAQVQADCGSTDGTSAWSSVYFTTPDACGAPTDLVTSNITATTATLGWADNQDSYNVRYRKVYFFEDFESETLPTGWTTIDANGDGNTFGIGSSTAHSGANGAYNISYIYNTQGVTPDDYLVSPQLDLQGTLRVWLSGYGARYNEHFAIYLSTAGNTASDFTTTLVGETTTTNGYVEYTADLSSYAGQQGYIAIRHFNCSDQYYLYVDDFGLYGSENWVSVTPSPTDATTTLTGLTPTIENGNHLLPTTYEWQVQGINCDGNGGTTDWSAAATFTTPEAQTFTISIEPFSTTDKKPYYLIASPIGDVNPENVTNMVTSETTGFKFDLYRFNQGAELEWENWKSHANNDANYHFSLEAGRGYLYANNTGEDLVFTGTAYSDDGEVTLSKVADDDLMPGYDFPDWNLVGNPFAETAYIADGRDFYTMTGDGSGFEVSSSPSIEAMEGVFVIAANNGEKMYFTTTAPANTGKSIVLNLGEGRQNIDRAIIRFGEGRTLPKLQFFEGSTKIYIPQDGKDYAVVRSEEMGAMPVNFKAEDNGTYTLNFSCTNVGFAYLHLIDNRTGNDVDLLQTPSYSFEAKTTDYESRFKLVFATGDNSNDDNFAFFSNGSFVINNDGAAELQVIDLMGRILSSETINGCTNVNVNAAPGVYMLRLINGTDVKVQKVVVK